MLEARAHCLTREHPGVFKARTLEAAELLLGPRGSRLLLGSFGSPPLSTIPLPPHGAALSPRLSAFRFLFGLELIQVGDRSTCGKPRNR